MSKPISTSQNFSQLQEKLAPYSAKYQASLRDYTTWSIGGPAEILVELEHSRDLLAVLKIAKAYDLPVTILGGGSNSLISDQGLKGLSIIYRGSSDLEIVQDDYEYQANLVQHRHLEENENIPYSFSDLDYVEKEPRALVKISAAYNLSKAIPSTIKQGLTGLQFFAGIPGTLGGALYNNIHGGTKHFSEYFVSADIVDLSKEELEIENWNHGAFEFGYDQSILREKNNIIILDLYLALHKGDTQRASDTAKEWMRRKKVQPRNTAGCSFKNIELDQQTRLGWPTPSVGYLVDKLLGYKNKTFGTVKISNWHANFIESDKDSKASDVLAAIEDIKTQAATKYELNLEPEVSIILDSKWNW